ncbi:MAG: DNA polymerase III subunit delta' [Chloroflexi bacterium]|nr:DNA polymerase III subunit delta' [Chloroflexota bacterium]
MWQTVGHDWAIDLLNHALRNERLAHAYLFAGLERVGKDTLATEFAAALNCMGQEPPCGECPACRKTLSGAHPDVITIMPQNGKIKIEQIREMQRQMALSPYEGRLRVCLISSMHLATTEAANALLKSLEEPPSRVVLLLTAISIELLPPTLVSRCQVLQLRPVAGDTILHTLRRREGQNQQQAELLSRLAAGRIGWAVAAARDAGLVATYHKQTESLLQLLEHNRGERLRAAEGLSKRENLREILQVWQVWWRDVLLVALNNEVLVTNIDQVETLRTLARCYGIEASANAYKSTGDTLMMLEQNVNPRLALEGLVLHWDTPPLIRNLN